MAKKGADRKRRSDFPWDLVPRNKEMKRLRFEENWNIRQIAELFNISRERVRQIIGTTGGGFEQKRLSKAILGSPEKTNSELAAELGITANTVSKYRKGTRYKIGGILGTRMEYEDFVSQHLTSIGIANDQMPPFHPFDILVRGSIRVDVKSADESKSLTKSAPVYSWPLGQKRRGRYADFFILVIRKTKDMFVIPASETRLNSPIRFSWPQSSRGRSKWAKYHNRFDLLEDYG